MAGHHAGRAPQSVQLLGRHSCQHLRAVEPSDSRERVVLANEEISGDIAWICGIAWEDVRWPVAVRAGDRLRARFECLSKRPSSTDATRGVVEFRYTLLNQRDEIAWTCRSINLVETGPRTAAA